MPTDHELLGVKRDAGTGEIRAAYIAALKRLHPDAAGPSDNAEAVSDLVGAYRRLSAAAERRAAIGGPVTLKVTRRPYLVPLQRSTPIVLIGKALTIALLAGTALAAFLINVPEQQIVSAAAANGAGPLASEQAVATTWGRPDEAVVRQAVGALQSFVPEDGAEAVEAHSRRCFAELESSQNLQVLDYCLAFDLAAMQSQAIGRAQRAGVEPAFFQPLELRARHDLALRLLIEDRQARQVRRSRIESETVAALAAAVQVNPLDRWPR